MKPSSKRMLTVAAILALILAVFVLLHLPHRSDQDQIMAQLDAAQAAADQRNANGVLKIVSAHYHDSDSRNNDQLAALLREAFRRGSSVTVSLATPSVQVHGETADSVSQVTVRPSQGGPPIYDSPVTLHWQREDGTRWLVFPAKVWRVVGADYQAPSGGDEGGGGLF